MNVAMTTSVSSNIAELAMLTTPNKLQYCLKHGYHLVVDNRPYDEAVDTFAETMLTLLDQYDLVWGLDSDALITNMDVPIHALPCIGPGMTVCPEGIVDWNLLNCGSTIWKSGHKSRYLLETLRDRREDWIDMPCQQQTWFGQCVKAGAGDLITVAPLRAHEFQYDIVLRNGRRHATRAIPHKTSRRRHAAAIPSGNERHRRRDRRIGVRR